MRKLTSKDPVTSFILTKLNNKTVVYKKKKATTTRKRVAKNGKKTYNIAKNVGKAKYVVSYHNGKTKHRDGSPFFDLRIFKNKSDLSNFEKVLKSKGYVYKRF